MRVLLRKNIVSPEDARGLPALSDEWCYCWHKDRAGVSICKLSKLDIVDELPAKPTKEAKEIRAKETALQEATMAAIKKHVDDGKIPRTFRRFGAAVGISNEKTK